MAIGVWIVDDHAVVRDGLGAFIQAQSDIVVVGWSASGDHALAHLRTVSGSDVPDVVILDQVMPGKDGVTTARELKEIHPDVAILMLSSFTDAARVRQALRAGAGGYLEKSAGPDDVLDAIRAVHRGRVYLDAEIARRLGAEDPDEPQGSDDLTPREREVLDLVAEGLSNREIAARLVITERTARSHVSSVLRKLGLPSRTMAALWVTRHRSGAPPLVNRPRRGPRH